MTIFILTTTSELKYEKLKNLVLNISLYILKFSCYVTMLQTGNGLCWFIYYLLIQDGYRWWRW